MNDICHLHSLNAIVPGTVITNDDLSRTVDTSDQWIFERTGIRQRRKIEDNANASDLGVNAARKALADAGISACDLTHVIAATCTPDELSPSIACKIAGGIGAGPVMSFDFSAACAGFIYGLSIAQGILAQNPDNKILFVCAEALTRRINWKDRSTCVLFGDAAAACVLSADSEMISPLASVEDVICQSDGKQHDLIVVGGGTSCKYAVGDCVDEKFFIRMHGRETYKHAVRQMVNVCEMILARNDLDIEDIALFVPHQANMRIIEAVGERLHLSSENVFTNLATYGNTSSASIPLALSEAYSLNRIPKGGRVLITAFGAGLTWGAALLRF